MGTLEDIRRMMQQGISEEDIIRAMQERGVPYKEIADSLAQSKIKAAVEEDLGSQIQQTQQSQYDYPNNMEKSMMNSDTQEYIAPEAPQYQQTQQYESYQPTSSLSTDTITEISEQIVAEKMSEIRKSLEKVIDLKTTIESRIEYLDERLKRIERTIDTLQTNVLRKTGENMLNLQDIKNELIETQKTFSKLLQK